MDITHIIQKLIISAPAILIAIILHELSHGYVANRLGDPTARMSGRLTLNPVAHIDPFGTIIMPVMLIIFTKGQFVFGYAKPVPINPNNFRNPKRDMAISAAAGPATNIALAVLSALIIKFFIAPIAAVFSGNIGNAVATPLMLMFMESIRWNIVLAVFNMIPIPPLDGGRVLVGLLPHRHAYSYSKIEPYGFIIVIILIMTGIAGMFIYPLMMLLYSFITFIL